MVLGSPLVTITQARSGTPARRPFAFERSPVSLRLGRGTIVGPSGLFAPRALCGALGPPM